MEVINQMREIVKTKSYRWLRCPVTKGEVMVDLFSASAILGVFDGANKKNKAHLLTLSIQGMCEVCFKVINKIRKDAKA